jgi:hypothetical protein
LETDFKKEGDKEANSVKKFKKIFRDLIDKFIQIGIINSANIDSKGTLQFMDARNSEKMNILDSFLSEKVNNTIGTRILETVIPALKVSMKNVIKSEAQKLLYSLNNQENRTLALFQLYGAKENPHLMQAQLFIKLMENELKDDPDIKELMSQRDSNIFMKKALNNHRIATKINQRLASLIDESPMIALQALCEAV